MSNTLTKQLRRYPTLRACLDQFWELVGGVSVRTKIMGIILALTITLGLGVTLLVRDVMTQTLLSELDKRGHSVVSDLGARSAAFILEGDTAGLEQLLVETLANHPDTRYAFVVDGRGQVIAHTFSQSVPAEILNLSAATHLGDEYHRHYENYEGQVHDFALSIPAGQGAQVRLGLAESRLQEIIDDFMSNYSVHY